MNSDFTSDVKEYSDHELMFMANDIYVKPDKQHQGPIRAIASAVIAEELKRRRFHPEKAAKELKLVEVETYSCGPAEILIVPEEVEHVEDAGTVEGGYSSMGRRCETYYADIVMKDGTVHRVEGGAGSIRVELGL